MKPITVGFSSNFKITSRLLVVVAIVACLKLVDSAKILDVNEKLSELIEKYPEKSWLVKFYAPWCHHCQQLEPTYANVGETIYHRHDELIVARVDCTKSGRTCEKYGIESYPTIIFLSRSLNIKYNGDRTEESLINFAERLMKPSVNKVDSCDQLKVAKNRHGLIVLSTIQNSTNELQVEFRSIADSFKSEYWFYQHDGPCKGMKINEGLYLMKKHLLRPIEFLSNSSLDQQDKEDLRRSIMEWMRKESMPIFEQIDQRNIHQILALEKILVLAILDRYLPAKKFAASSHKFHSLMQRLAIDFAQRNNDLIFGWTSDVNLAEYITITPISLPNLIILKHNFQYHLLVGRSSESSKSTAGDLLPNGLSETNVRSKLSSILANELPFDGGNTFMYTTLRQIFSNYSKFVRMYRANALLVSLIFGFPSIIVIFVIYTTCFYDGSSNDDEADQDDQDDPENDHLLSDGHLKQD